jgi:hypothetical protein
MGGVSVVVERCGKDVSAVLLREGRKVTAWRVRDGELGRFLTGEPRNG